MVKICLCSLARAIGVILKILDIDFRFTGDIAQLGFHRFLLLIV